MKERPPLPRTSPLIAHTKKYLFSLLCTKVLFADYYYSLLSHNTMVNCLYACLSHWTVSCFIHLCILSTYQDQAHGWHSLNVHWMELNRTENFPFTQPTQLWAWTSQSTHAQACFAALDSKSKLQAPCKFSSQRDLWGKGIFKKQFFKRLHVSYGFGGLCPQYL